MFGLFKKKTEKEKLQEAHANLLKKVFEESKINRKKADQLAAEAEELAKQIENLA